MQREMPLPALDATKTVVVHSTGDTLVPIAHSMELEQVAKVRQAREEIAMVAVDKQHWNVTHSSTPGVSKMGRVTLT